MDFCFTVPKPPPFIPIFPKDGVFGEEDITNNQTTERGRRWLFSRVNFLQEMMKFLPTQRSIAPLSGENLDNTLDLEDGINVHSKSRFPGNVNEDDFWAMGTISKEDYVPGLDFHFGASEFQHFDFVGNEKESKWYDEFNEVQYQGGEIGDIDEAMDAFKFYDMTYVYKRRGSGYVNDEDLKYVLDYSKLFEDKKSNLSGSRNYFEWIYENFNQNSNGPDSNKGIAWILGLIESKRRIAFAQTELWGSHRPYARTISYPGQGDVEYDFSSYGSLDELSDADKISKTKEWLDPTAADWRGKEAGQHNLFLLTLYFELWNHAGQWVGTLSAGRPWNDEASATFDRYKTWMDGIFSNFKDNWIFSGNFDQLKNQLDNWDNGNAPRAEDVRNLFSSFKILPVYVKRELAKLDGISGNHSKVEEVVGTLNDLFNEGGIFSTWSKYKEHVLTSLKAEFFGHLDEDKDRSTNDDYYPMMGGLSNISMYPISSEGFNGIERAWSGGNYWVRNCEGWDGGKSVWTDRIDIADEIEARSRGSMRGLFSGLSFNEVTNPNLELHLWLHGEDKGNARLYDHSFGFYTYHNLLNRTNTYLGYAFETKIVSKALKRQYDKKMKIYKEEKARDKEQRIDRARERGRDMAKRLAKAREERKRQMKLLHERRAISQKNSLKRRRPERAAKKKRA
ncbi:hypothetical protein AMJ44_04430 [candidate division WOR-1 bacterium DG_54_3]|uniref:Uncharacterized protein n=1 Tax=candidate division WOR-1 bacterium DG_54_3 TaxID=1703775 RepID=A0A0S7Y355_UNCSA|nr:MAG: hypothetical protein AMJ44_04430 [candidate division WOR-1 bacterium DG_54_3]